MIWATVSSQPCFCWLYRAFLSLAPKDIINLIFVLTIRCCPLVELSLCCWKRVFALTRAFSRQNLLAFPLLHFVLQGQTCLLFQVSPDFLLLHSSPLWQRGHLFFGVSSRRSCRSSEPFNFSFFGISGWCTDLEYCDTEWFALEMNEQRLYPSTAFQTLLLTMRATPFLLRNSCP